MEIDKKLTELLKRKIVKEVAVSAFPDMFIFFEDGTVLYYEFDTLIDTTTTGDEMNVSITVSKNHKELFADKESRKYYTTGHWK